MSIITAYKSDSDGRIFEDKKRYQSHLRKLAIKRRHDRKVLVEEEKKLAFLRENFWEKVKSPIQLEAALLAHAEFFGLNGLAHETFHGDKRPSGPPILKKFDRFSLDYSDRVSNSHSCPHSGVTNWANRNKNAPGGYPGLYGRIEYCVEWYSDWDGYYPGSSSMWKKTRIHTGGGGGGSFVPYAKNSHKGLQRFGFQVELFFDDWPGLKEGYEKASTWKILSDSNEDIITVMNELFPAELD